MADNPKLLIIGNGPSTAAIADAGLHRLRGDVDTFGMGAAYRYFEQISWWPTFYALGDRKVAFSHRAALKRIIEDAAVPTRRFFASWPVTEADRFELIEHTSTGDFCLRKALELGYREIYLIGIEGNYTEKITESRLLSAAEQRALGFEALELAEADRQSLRIISRTPERNPNYFFAGYQQQGDVYSLPRSDAHRRRWTDAAELAYAAGARVTNLSAQSRVLDFPRANDRAFLFDAQAPVPCAECLGPFSREQEERLDEADVVFDLLTEQPLSSPVMVDVGACHGRAFRAFAEDGWTVHAFEPNPPLHEALAAAHEADDRVTISNQAVSDAAGQELPFYTSEESLGISSLKPFRDSHEVTATVSTITLAGYLQRNRIDHVDFLKVDTEGFDLMVLKGAELDQHHVDVIVCEFEDAKTRPLGYSTYDMADYLVSAGYSVYVSEWHPVRRYGGPHEWRALKRYPCKLEDPDAWGNLVAFRSDPGFPAVARAVRHSMKHERSHEEAPRAVPQRALYAGIGEALKARSPRAFHVVRFAWRSLAATWRRRRWTLPAFLLLGGTGLLGLTPAFTPYRELIWGGVAVAALALGLTYLAMRLQLLQEASAAAAAAREHEARSLRKRMSRLARENVALRKQLSAELAGLGAELSAQRQGVEEQITTLRAEHGARARELADAVAEQKALLAGARLDLEALHGRLKALGSDLKDAVRSAQAATKDNHAAIKSNHAAIKNSEIALRDLRHATTSDQQRLRERIAAGERQLGLLRYPDAPRCIVLFGHHKCGSRFFRNEIFTQLAEMLDARIRRYEIKDPPFHYSRGEDLDLCNMDLSKLGEDGVDIVMFGNATPNSLRAIRDATKDWKGLRVIRDPRQVLVSGYFHHRGDHVSEGPQGWIWDQLAKDKPVLLELPEEEGLLYELDHISKDVIESQLRPPFDDERVLTVRLESFAEAPREHLRQIAEFLEVPDIAGIDLGNTSANEDSDTWTEHFTPRLREVFKERYGEDLIKLGYATDLDW